MRCGAVRTIFWKRRCRGFPPVFQANVLVCINADFYEQGRIFQHFSSSTFFPLHRSKLLRFFRNFAPFLQNFSEFLLIFRRRQQILHFFVEFQWIFPGISQNFNDFGKSDVKILIIQKNLRKLLKICKKLTEKLLKICPKKNVCSKCLRW